MLLTCVAVAVTVAADDGGQQVALSPADGVLLFDADDWDVPQTVTVTALADDVVEGVHSVSLSVTASSSEDAAYEGVVLPYSVDVSIYDDGEQDAIALSLASVRIAEGGPSVGYSVVLLSRPDAPVTVSASVGGDGGAFVSVSDDVVFDSDNWASPQSFVLTATEDFIASGSQTFSLVHLASSGDDAYDGSGAFVPSAVASVEVEDDDTVGVRLSAVSLLLSEGGPAGAYTVVLKSKPAGPVTVLVSSDDDGGSAINLAVSQLVFNSLDFDVAQSVAVSAVDDDFAEGTQTCEYF